MVAIAEVAQVNKVPLLPYENDIAVLQVPVDGRIFIRCVSDKAGQLVFLYRREERILRQKTIVTVLDILELSCVDVRGVKLLAHPCEFRGILRHVFRMVGRCARIGFLAKNSTETDAVASVFRHHIFTRFRCGNAKIIHLAGQIHLVQRLLDLSRKVKLEHDGRIRLMVVALTVGAAAGEDVIVEGNLDGFHYANT